MLNGENMGFTQPGVPTVRPGVRCGVGVVGSNSIWKAGHGKRMELTLFEVTRVDYAVTPDPALSLRKWSALAA